MCKQEKFPTTLQRKSCPVLKKVYTYNNKNVSKIKIKYYV